MSERMHDLLPKMRLPAISAAVVVGILALAGVGGAESEKLVVRPTLSVDARGNLLVKVTPVRASRGARIHLQRRAGASWRTIATSTLDRLASARFRIKLPAGASVLRAFVPASRRAGRPVGYSKSLAVRAAAGGSLVFDREALVSALRAAGLTMSARGTTNGDVLGVRSYNYENREGPVQVFEFAGEERARAASTHVSKNGHDITSGNRVSHYDWIAPPHWFRGGRLVVLYLGTDATALAALRRILGEQFAGS